MAEYATSGYGAFKIAVAESIAEGVRPIREAYEAMSDDEVARVMSLSAERAREMADENHVRGPTSPQV